MKILKFAIIATLFIGFYSCESDKVSDNELFLLTAKGKNKQSNENSALFDFSEDCVKTESILYAGQNIEVGKIIVTEENEEYIITYKITNPDWCMTETHLSVQNTPEDFPLNGGGNPMIGQFEMGDDNLNCSKEETYSVPIDQGPYIAAHAVVVCINNSPGTIIHNLPETVNFCTTDEFRPNNGERYFDISIDGGFLSGDYSAWCVDVDKALGNPECIENVNIYSSLGSLPEGAFEQIDNFGAVNWLLNQEIVGTTSISGGLYTGDDLQLAIWLMVDDLLDLEQLADVGNVENWSNDRVNELVSMALENKDFIPDCGDLIGIIIDPGTRQKLIFGYPLNCSSCNETAWADGCNFPGNNWATYFEYGHLVE